ncbi:uncharacterized protein [Clytia hemisphaerica]|uniref:Platelet-derived growth factor (PDGF) family profile domain-containing protein n=1 Tax=Clytia hemisphaerica TaxID=252671 RepID=A0A7M5VH57_9CNID
MNYILYLSSLHLWISGIIAVTWNDFLRENNVYVDWQRDVTNHQESFRCYPSESLVEINKERTDVLPSYIKMKTDCTSCCLNSLFECVAPRKIMKMKKFKQFSTKHVYLGESQHAVFEVDKCICRCRITSNDCPPGTRFEKESCACIDPVKFPTGFEC